MSSLTSWMAVAGTLGSVGLILWQVARHAGILQIRQEHAERAAEERHRENRDEHKTMLAALMTLDRTSAVHEQRIDSLEGRGNGREY